MEFLPGVAKNNPKTATATVVIGGVTVYLVYKFAGDRVTVFAKTAYNKTKELVTTLTTGEKGAFLAGGAAIGSTGMVSAAGVKVDVYPIIVCAKEAFGTTPLRGQGSIHPMVLNPGVPSKSDPLGQRGYVSWKTWFAAVILNQAWMVRLEVGATDLNDVN